VQPHPGCELGHGVAALGRAHDIDVDAADREFGGDSEHSGDRRVGASTADGRGVHRDEGDTIDDHGATVLCGTMAKHEGATIERAARWVERTGRRIPGLRTAVLSPVIARPGYWFASACGLLWGGILSRFRLRRTGGVVLAAGLPTWAFGRGGTTIGSVYLTSGNVTPAILEHESVHRAQWKRYGLAFVPLYVAAGQNALGNRFEIEAGLTKGGYA
jgi:hypothetical protein